MKRFLVSLVMLSLLCSSVYGDDGDPVIEGKDTGYLYVYDTDTYATLNALVSAISTNKATIWFRQDVSSSSTSYTVGTSLNIPANITLRFDCGAMLNVSSGVTLTHIGYIDAGPWQIFTGSGTVNLVGSSGRISNEFACAAWWGMAVANSDNGTYLQKAINGCSFFDNSIPLKITSGIYNFQTGVTISTEYFTLFGEGRGWTETRLNMSTLPARPYALIQVAAANVTVRDMALYCALANNTNSKGIYFNAGSGGYNAFRFSNLWIHTFEYGVYAYGLSFYSFIEDCLFWGCGRNSTGTNGAAIYMTSYASTSLGSEVIIRQCKILNGEIATTIGADYGIYLNGMDTVSIEDTDVLAAGGTYSGWYAVQEDGIYIKASTASKGSNHHISNCFVESGLKSALRISGYNSSARFDSCIISDTLLAKKSLGGSPYASLIVDSGDIRVNGGNFAPGENGVSVIYDTTTSGHGIVNLVLSDCHFQGVQTYGVTTYGDGTYGEFNLSLVNPYVDVSSGTLSNILVYRGDLSESKWNNVNIIGGLLHDLVNPVGGFTTAAYSKFTMLGATAEYNWLNRKLGIISTGSYSAPVFTDYALLLETYGSSYLVQRNTNDSVEALLGAGGSLVEFGSITNHDVTFNRGTGSGWSEKLRITTSGINVTGNVTATDTCCDFVLEPGYALPTLEDVRASVETKHKLPGLEVPNGLSMKDLMVKTEEQALYILQLHDRLKKLEEAIAQTQKGH